MVAPECNGLSPAEASATLGNNLHEDCSLHRIAALALTQPASYLTM